MKFGPQGRLVGILSGASLPASAPTLVLPNAGLLPRAGPFRLHVELAQRLFARGIRTFRFESPGVGETPRLKGCDARAATLAALDHLAAEFGCTRFVVGGICSAADAGWDAAVRDERVAAVVMLDGIAFLGPWFHFARIVDALQRRPRTWPKALAGLFGRVGLGRGAPRQASDAEQYREWPSRPEAQRQFAALLARDVRSLWIYTGGYSGRFRHPRQFAWSLGAGTGDPRVVMHYWEDCDHTFFARAHRDRLLVTIERWLVDAATGAAVTMSSAATTSSTASPPAATPAGARP